MLGSNTKVPYSHEVLSETKVFHKYYLMYLNKKRVSN